MEQCKGKVSSGAFWKRYENKSTIDMKVTELQNLSTPTNEVLYTIYIYIYIYIYIFFYCYLALT